MFIQHNNREGIQGGGGGPLLNDFLRPELDREMIPHSLSTFRMRNKL